MSDDTTQYTLDMDTQTVLVNQKHTNDYDVDIGRANRGGSNLNNTEPSESGWLGNPYALSDGYDRAEAVQLYREDFRERLQDDTFRAAVEELRGKRLACHCVAGPTAEVEEPLETCHGEVILAYLTGDL